MRYFVVDLACMVKFRAVCVLFIHYQSKPETLRSNTVCQRVKACILPTNLAVIWIKGQILSNLSANNTDKDREKDKLCIQQANSSDPSK